jgi:4-hydroxy-tetrahydrodipicolinate synthase
LINLLFTEANPIPVKKAVQLMGLLDNASMRLPLMELTPDLTEKLKIEMKNLGLV